MKPKRPRAYPLRCPGCNDADAIAVIKQSGTRDPSAQRAFKLECDACGYRWWSTHRDVGGAVQRFLEARGQQQLFSLDSP